MLTAVSIKQENEPLGCLSWPRRICSDDGVLSLTLCTVLFIPPFLGQFPLGFAALD